MSVQRGCSGEKSNQWSQELQAYQLFPLSLALDLVTHPPLCTPPPTPTWQVLHCLHTSPSFGLFWVRMALMFLQVYLGALWQGGGGYIWGALCRGVSRHLVAVVFGCILQECIWVSPAGVYLGTLWGRGCIRALCCAGGGRRWPALSRPPLGP